MNVSIYNAAAAMGANVRLHEVLTENLTGGDVAGFKRSELTFEAVQAGLWPNSANPVVFPRTSLVPNFSPGATKPTGSKTDFALEGPGFFQVQMPNGRVGYTRDGQFQISPDGNFVTKAGYPVLSDGGAIRIDAANPRPVTVADTGEISQGTEVIGTLRMVEFDDVKALTPVAGGIYLPLDPNLEANPAEKTRVRQGYVETSNSSPVVEMGELMRALRNFEVNQRVLQQHDDRMGRAIAAIGNNI